MLDEEADCSDEDTDGSAYEDDEGGDDGFISPGVRDHAIRMLCCPEASDSIRWKDLAKSGMGDDELRGRLAALWIRPVTRDMPPCAASSKMGPPLMWLGQNHAQGTPTYSGDELLEHVRRVMGIAEADEGGKPPLTPGPSPAAGRGKRSTGSAKEFKAAVGPIDPMAGVEVVGERDVPWAEIKRSKHNPRTVFDENLIASMEPSIETICKVTPITIREGTNELIDGETRHRAAEKRKPALRCKILRCTDGEAAAMRLASAVKRRDLDAIARARAMKGLQEEHGYSQAQVAEFAELKEQGSVSNYTRLLELPDVWQQRIINKEISGAKARELVPWTDEPAVLKAFDKSFSDHQKGVAKGNVEYEFDFSDELQSAISQNCKKLVDGHHWTGTRSIKIDLTEHRDKLRVREVKRYGRTEEYAFDVKLWGKLVKELEKKAATSEGNKRDREGGQSGKGKAKAEPTPAQKKENAKKQAEQLAKRLYRYRTSWYQAMAIAALEKASFADLNALLLFNSFAHGNAQRQDHVSKVLKVRLSHKSGSFWQMNTLPLLQGILSQKTNWEVIRSMLKHQIGTTFEGYNVTFTPAEIELTATHLGVDLKRDWPKSFEKGAPCEKLWDDFLALWTKDQFVALLKEWKISFDKPESAKRTALAAVCQRTKPVPAAIEKAKEVRL